MHKYLVEKDTCSNTGGALVNPFKQEKIKKSSIVRTEGKKIESIARFLEDDSIEESKVSRDIFNIDSSTKKTAINKVGGLRFSARDEQRYKETIQTDHSECTTIQGWETRPDGPFGHLDGEKRYMCQDIDTHRDYRHSKSKKSHKSRRIAQKQYEDRNGVSLKDI